MLWVSRVTIGTLLCLRQPTRGVHKPKVDQYIHLIKLQPVQLMMAAFCSHCLLQMKFTSCECIT